MFEEKWEYDDGELKLGPALGVFSNIWSDRFTDSEKLKAVQRVMLTNSYANVPKVYMIEVVKWLAGKLAEKAGG